jgi:pantothenate kinase
MPNRLDNPVAHLLRLLPSHSGRPERRILIALAGLPGSGKSTVAARLADAVNTHAGAGVMVALGMDGFHFSKAELARFPDPAEALKRRGAPWTFDAAALAQRLQDLRDSHQSVLWPDFEHGVGDPVADAITVLPSTRIVLVEGLYLLHDDHGWQHAHLFDECWYLNVPMDIAMERLVQRHMAANHQSREVAMQRLAVNDRLNADIVQKSLGRAQWLIENVR